MKGFQLAFDGIITRLREMHDRSGRSRPHGPTRALRVLLRVAMMREGKRGSAWTHI